MSPTLSGIQTILMPVISGRPNLSAFCFPAPQNKADKEPRHTCPHPHHRYRLCQTSESGESSVSPSLLSISVVFVSYHVSLNVNAIFYVWVSLNGIVIWSSQNSRVLQSDFPVQLAYITSPTEFSCFPLSVPEARYHIFWVIKYILYRLLISLLRKYVVSQGYGRECFFSHPYRLRSF